MGSHLGAYVNYPFSESLAKILRIYTFTESFEHFSICGNLVFVVRKGYHKFPNGCFWEGELGFDTEH